MVLSIEWDKPAKDKITARHMKKHHLKIHEISRGRFMHTVILAILCSLLVVSIAATLGRATINMKAALTDKPDIAVYMLLPNENIHHVTLLRSKLNDTQRDYLLETKSGMELVKLQKRNGKWFVSKKEKLRE